MGVLLTDDQPCIVTDLAHEAFYGKGKEYLFLTLGIESDSPHPLVELLENFN